MEILFISHKYPPATGGMEKQSFELIEGMKRLAKVHAIIYQGEGSKLLFFLSLNKRIKETLAANPGISILHFNDGLIAAFSLLYPNYGNVKRTLTFHGLDVVFPGTVYQKYIFPRFNAFDLIFAVSKATAHACEVRGIASEKIVVVNNGVDTSLVQRADREDVNRLLFQKYNIVAQDRKILVAMGRPVKRKGFSWFIKNVLPHLHKEYLLLLIGPVSKNSVGKKLFNSIPTFIRSNIELLLGLPSDEHAVSQLLNQEEYRSTVRRMGKLPLEEVHAILDIADAFVMPNIEVEGDMEGFGLVCLEASMRGTKVYAAASGGITDAIVHQQNGILLPPGDADVWIYFLNQLIDDPTSPQLSLENIADFTRNNFSWDKMCAAYFKHFSKIIA